MKITTTPLESDEPIQGATEDKLSRGPLVELLATNVARIGGREAVVIALNAPWGAGKSSFLNLLTARLEQGGADAAQSGAIVVRFNPWMVSSLEQLVETFFNALADGIGSSTERVKAEKIANTLRKFGDALSVFNGGIAKASEVVAGMTAEKPTLLSLRRELNDALPGFAQRVVVIIDDIDRLERDTLRYLFKMIRLNADFSNLTYVLAFDRRIVESQLTDPGISGRDYLEKIVQVSFDLPPPEENTLRELFFAELNSLLEALDQNEFDTERWSELFLNGMARRFKTVRNIKRYANALRLTVPSVLNEVDAVDLLGLEFLRVFHPSVYDAVASSKEMFAPSTMRLGDRKTDELKTAVESIVGVVDSAERDSVRETLQAIFPPVARSYDVVGSAGEPRAEWRLTRRACAPEYFDRYFLLRVPSGDVSRAEFDVFLRYQTDDERQNFARSVVESKRNRSFLHGLSDRLDTMPVAQRAAIADFFLRRGAVLVEAPRSMFEPPTEWLMASFVDQRLEDLSSEEARSKYLASMSAEADLYMYVSAVSTLTPKAGQTAIMEASTWEQAKELARQRLVDASVSGELWKHEYMPRLAMTWLEWTTPDTIRAWVAQNTTTDEELIAFLERLIVPPDAHAGRRDPVLPKKVLNAFLVVDDVRARLDDSIKQNQDERVERLSRLLTQTSTFDW